MPGEEQSTSNRKAHFVVMPSHLASSLKCSHRGLGITVRHVLAIWVLPFYQIFNQVNIKRRLQENFPGACSSELRLKVARVPSAVHHQQWGWLGSLYRPQIWGMGQPLKMMLQFQLWIFSSPQRQAQLRLNSALWNGGAKCWPTQCQTDHGWVWLSSIHRCEKGITTMRQEHIYGALRRTWRQSQVHPNPSTTWPAQGRCGTGWSGVI